MRKRVTTEIFIERSKAIHGDKYDYTNSEYIKSDTKVKIRCNGCGNEWEIHAYHHFRGRGCKKCGYDTRSNQRTRTNEEFVVLAKSIHGEKFEYLTEYTLSHSPVKIKCLECNTTFEQVAFSHLSGRGCRKCADKELSKNKCLSPEEFEEKCKIVHNDNYSYFGDYRGREYEIKIFCKIHQEYFLQNSGCHISGYRGCLRCAVNSKGEITIKKFLDSRRIEYQSQKRFDGCVLKRRLAFDFYLPKYNLCIEYDGVQHYELVEAFGGQEGFDRCKASDEAKDIFCNDNNIELLRIPYFEFDNIESIIKARIGIP